MVRRIAAEDCNRLSKGALLLRHRSQFGAFRVDDEVGDLWLNRLAFNLPLAILKQVRLSLLHVSLPE